MPAKVESPNGSIVTVFVFSNQICIYYFVTSRLRRGRQTHILLNMCATLMCYVIFLLSSIAFCDTIVGCRIANVIRVYLILVSLMWNGVEGVHMYLTVVKVFWGYTKYFVFKSGIIAWGKLAVFGIDERQ